MGGTIQLETKRLVLRKHVAEDAEFLYSVLGTDEASYEYSGWNPYATPEMARETVGRFIDSYDDEDFYGWAITLDGEIIGTIGAYDYDPEESSIEAGISIAREYWGRGYATEAIERVLRYLTEDRKIGVVKAWCADDNIGSSRIMEKCGMTKVNVEKGALEINGKVYARIDYEYSAM